VRKLQYPIATPFDGMTSSGSDLYLYSSAPFKRLAKITIDAFSNLPDLAISGQMNIDFSAQAFDAQNEILYLSAFDHIRVIDLKTGQQSQLGVYETIAGLEYSAAQHTLYIAHDNNSISYIDLSAAQPANTPVFQNTSNTIDMMPINDQMLIGRASGNAHLISPTKQVVQTSFTSSANEQQHYFSNLQQYLKVSSQRGYLFQLRDDYSLNQLHYFSNKNLTNPIYSIDSHNQFVTSQGSIFGIDINGISSLGVLANDIIDAVRYNEQLVTLKTSGKQHWLQRWFSNYDKEEELSLPAADDYRLHMNDSAIYIVSHNNGNFRYMKYNTDGFSDSDGDGINDFNDNCPNISNPDQLNYDGDRSGDLCDQDADNDGLNNQLETDAGLNPLNSNDTLQDSDGDGVSNGLEALTGTDLTDEQSKPTFMPEFDINFASNNWQIFLQQSTEDFGDWYLGSTLYPWAAANAQNENVLFHSVLTKNYQRIGLQLAAGSTDAWLTLTIQRDRDHGDTCQVYVLTDGRDMAIDIDSHYSPHTYVYEYRIPLFANTSSVEFGARTPHEDYWREDGCSDSLELLAVKLTHSQHPLDFDNDGINNLVDNCPNISNSSQTDSNRNGIGNACQLEFGPDADDDGVYNQDDNCPSMYNPEQTNTDNDSEGDVCDSDDDNDGFSDYQEISLGMNPLVYDDPYGDPDGDGIDTRTEVLEGTDPLTKDFNGLINIADYFNGIGYGHWNVEFDQENNIDLYLERKSNTQFWYGTSQYKMLFNTASGLTLEAVFSTDPDTEEIIKTYFKPAIRVLRDEEPVGRTINHFTDTIISGTDSATGENFEFDGFFKAETTLYAQRDERGEFIGDEIGITFSIYDERNNYTMIYLSERWSKKEGLLGIGAGDYGFYPARPIEVKKGFDSGKSGGNQSLLFIALLSIFAWRMRSQPGMSH